MLDLNYHSTNYLDWIEKIVDKKTLWYNVKTKQSNWFKPVEFRTNLEIIVYSATKWLRETDENRLVYFNNLTYDLTYTEPAEFSIIKASNEKYNSENNKVLNNKQEEKQYFHDYLNNRCIGAYCNWETFTNLFNEDSKYTIIKLLTTKEKKNIFRDHCQKIQRKEQEKIRALKSKLSDEYLEYLQSIKNTDTVMYKKIATKQHNFFDIKLERKWYVLGYQKLYETFLIYTESEQNNIVHDNLELLLYALLTKNNLGIDLPIDITISIIYNYFDGALLRCQIYLAFKKAVKKFINSSFYSLPTLFNVIAYEIQLASQWNNLLEDCEKNKYLDAKTSFSNFLRSRINESLFKKYSILPTHVDGDYWIKRNNKIEIIKEKLRLAYILKANDVEVGEAIEESENTISIVDLPLYHEMLLQTTITAFELFDIYVYNLWDIYSNLKDLVKEKIRAYRKRGIKFDTDKFISSLPAKHNRTGVINLLKCSIYKQNSRNL